MGNHLFKIGDVTFLKEIGHGSFGKVYEAERKGQTVAAKQLHKHIYIKNRSVVDKFFTECGTLRGLNHRNIVTMIDVLVPGGEIPPVLITELLFCDLAQYLKKHGSIELPKVVSIALDVAEGLRYLHKRSLPIAHRDLASKNVLLTLDGTAKIADFGLVAVFVQPELASPNPGTPVYAAPETFLQTTSGGQHGSKEYDVRVDVFAFGVLVLEMITGHRPRPTSPVGEDGRLIPERERRTKDIAEMGKNHSLSALVLGCIHDDSQARPTSGELVENLSSKKSEIDEKLTIVRGGQVKLKIITLGASGVGKTCILQRYLDPQLDTDKIQASTGPDIDFKCVSYQGISFKLQMEDTLGQERFRSIFPNYLRDANAILLVFDTTERTSFAEEVHYYLGLVASRFESREVSVVLVGNKVDQVRRQVGQNEASALARRYGMPYIETSAKTRHNIEQLFEMVVEMVYDRLDLGDIQDYIDRSKSTSHSEVILSEKQSGCCS